MPATDPDQIEAFLLPLARLARKRPEIEALVFWSNGAGWGDTPFEMLEAEEIAYYAEGLLIDGFRMAWAVIAAPNTPDLPDHVRLWFWQDDCPRPGASMGWTVLETDLWPGS